MDQPSNQTPVQTKSVAQWIALVMIIVIIGGFVIYLVSKKTNEAAEVYAPKTEVAEQPPTQNPSSAPSAVPSTIATQPSTPTPVPATKPVVKTPSTQKTVYKNGTYSADGAYYAPSGLEPFGVTITLSNDVVTNVQIGVNSQNGTSYRYQQRFAQSVNSIVVGKKLDQIQLDAVSGASLTTGGFMNALQNIQSQARA